MRETEKATGSNQDPLAEIVRAAGRRESPPQAHFDQVYVAAHGAWRNKVQSRRRNRWFAIAASLAVVTGGGVLAYLVQTGDAGLAATVAVVQGSVEQLAPDSEAWEEIPGNGFLMTAGTRIRTTDNSRVAVTLAEGGSLRLDVNTELSFGIDAIALSSGTIYFDSFDRSPELAVRVSTPLGDVRDIGTQFELSAEAEYLRIRVREGEVELLGAITNGEVIADFRDEIELTEDGNLTRRLIAPDDEAWSWAEGLASIPDGQAQSILTYFRWIARETGKRLEFESDGVELAAEFARFVGNTEGLTPLALLSSIAATSDFRYSLTTDGALLVGRN